MEFEKVLDPETKTQYGKRKLINFIPRDEQDCYYSNGFITALVHTYTLVKFLLNKYIYLFKMVNDGILRDY